MKILLKGKTRNNKTCWVHFCYIPKELVPAYLKLTVNVQFRELLKKWSLIDFGVYKLTSLEDIETLRNNIREHYKQKYPDMYIESNTDSQGWIRVWCSKHLREEMVNYDN